MRLERLTVRRDFLRVAKGRSAARSGVVVQARPSPSPSETTVRVGFTASKKVGDAVRRNRAKRRLREAARAQLPLYGRAGVDYVLIARASTVTRAWPRLLDDVKSALISLDPGEDRAPPGDGDRPSPHP